MGKKFLVVLGLSLALPAAARAQSNDRTLAEALFSEGKRLQKEGKLDEACPKFDDSYKAFPGTGALFNAANCYEQAGKTATAWGRYGEAAAAARRDGNSERVQLAESKRSALEPKLARLKVEVAAAVKSTPGLEVKVGDRAIPPTAFGVSVPVDPGHVVVLASAPQREAFKAELDIAQGSNETVKIEALTASAAAAEGEPAPTAPASTAGTTAASEPTSTGSDGSGQRTVGYVVGGVGLVGLTVGVLFNVMARGAASDADKDCLGDSPSGACNLTTPDQISARKTNLDSAESKALVSYIALGAGTAALATGVVLVLTASSKQPEGVARVTPLLGPGQVGLSVSGAL